MCPLCSVRFYGTCWHQSPPPDYSHCQTRVSAPAHAYPALLPHGTPEMMPAPIKEKEAELPKPKLKEKTKDKAEATKPKILNISYHTIDPVADPRKPAEPVGPYLR